MAQEPITLTRRRTLLGITTIGVAGTGAGLGTSALFSDTETFESNTIQAGTSNLVAQLGVEFINSSDPEAVGVSLEADSFEQADGPVVDALITVDSMLPGDELILRTTVDVRDNPMFVALRTTNPADDENTQNPDPEVEAQTAGTDPDQDTDGLPGEGDLDNRLACTFGYDVTQTQGGPVDRRLQGRQSIEPEAGYDGSTSATDLVTDFESGYLYCGRNDATTAPPGGHGASSDPPTRVGGDASLATVDREEVNHFLALACPDSVGNEVQGDSVSFGLRIGATQARNNDVSGPGDVFGP